MSNTTAPAAVPCANYFTTAKGEHWCSVEVGTEHAHSAYAAGRTTAHEGPCVEITDRWGAVENTVWAAMRSNAHLIRPEGELTVDQDALRAEAIVLDQTRELQRWTSDTPPSKPTDWDAVAEYATKRVHFTEDEWALLAKAAADGNAVAKAEEAVLKSTSATGRVSAVAVPGNWRMQTVHHTQKCRDDNNKARDCNGRCAS